MKVSVGIYWDEDLRTVDQIAELLAASLHEFRSNLYCEEVWRDQGQSKVEADALSGAGIAPPELATRLETSRFSGSGDTDIRWRFPYLLGLYSPAFDGTALSLTAGLTDGRVNSLILAINDFSGLASDLARLLKSLVELWDPDFGLIWNRAVFAMQKNIPLKKRAGWATYRRAVQDVPTGNEFSGENLLSGVYIQSTEPLSQISSKSIDAILRGLEW